MRELKPIDEKHWKNADTVQTACNMSGVLHSFLEAVRAIREAGGDTDTINSHPITRAFADKVGSLAGVQTIGNDRAMEAHGAILTHMEGE